MKFIKIRYRINGGFSGIPRDVVGYAFETPGWPEFHACVRFDRREGHEKTCSWILDHYESGLALRAVGPINKRGDAPDKLAEYLNEKGPEVVAAALRNFT